MYDAVRGADGEYDEFGGVPVWQWTCGGAAVRLSCVCLCGAAARAAFYVGGRTGTQRARTIRVTAIEPALLLKCVVNTDRRLRDRWEIVSP